MEPRRVTHLLYSSNLSYAQLVKYLKLVKEMGLAAEQKEPFHCYSITDDGKYFIQMEKKRKKLN
jgi:predicted transcriptional regulator